MATTQVTLSNSYGGFVRQQSAEGELEFNDIDFRQVAEATAAVDTISVPEEAIQEYHSIASLAGQYADDPAMKNFSDFLEQYRQEINDLFEE